MQMSNMRVLAILAATAPIFIACPLNQEVIPNKHYANRWVDGKNNFVEFAVCDFTEQDHASLLKNVQDWKKKIYKNHMTGGDKVDQWCGTTPHPAACCGAYTCQDGTAPITFAILYNQGGKKEKHSKQAVQFVHNQLRHGFQRQKKFTCLQENVLREVMALSFELSATTGKKWRPAQAKGHDHIGKDLKENVKAFYQIDNNLTTPGDTERKIRTISNGMALGPRLIRMTFHDAIDYDNTMNIRSAKKITDKNSPDFGGVDFHLNNAPLSVGLTQVAYDEDAIQEGGGDPNHNRGLNNAVKWVMWMNNLQPYLNAPDSMVLGAITAMEVWLDPDRTHKIDFRYGRRQHKGDPYCMNDECFEAQEPPTVLNEPVAEPVGVGMMCPQHNTLGNLAELLGLTRRQLVALQGAHSVGGIIRCSGLGNTAAGPYCPNKCAPPFEGKGDPEKDALDGSAFDETPSNLDNEYFKQLAAMLETDDQGNTMDPVVPYCKDLKNKMPTLGSPQQGKGYSKSGRDQTCSAPQDYYRTNFCAQEECLKNCMTSDVCAGHEYLDRRDQRGGFGNVSGAEFYTAAFDDSYASGKEVSDANAAMDVTKDMFDSWRMECRSCRANCMPEKLQKGGERQAKQKDPEWCMSMGGRRLCLVDAGHGECPEDKRVGIANFGGGREAFVSNIKKWTYFRGALRRIALLPSDISNLNDHADTSDDSFAKWVQHYAANPASWSQDYDEAYAKIACNGYWDKANGVCALPSCLAVGCTVLDNGMDISCGKDSRAGGTDDLGRPFEVVFEVDKGAGSMTPGTACSLVTNVGLRGTFNCGNSMEVLALAKGAKEFAARVDQWNADPTSGTKKACTGPTATSLTGFGAEAVNGKKDTFSKAPPQKIVLKIDSKMRNDDVDANSQVATKKVVEVHMQQKSQNSTSGKIDTDLGGLHSRLYHLLYGSKVEPARSAAMKKFLSAGHLQANI